MAHNAEIVRLDGQQIKARKLGFNYNAELEESRLFLARMVDLLKKEERIALSQSGGNLQAVQFPPEGSKLDITLGVFVEVLRALEGVETLLKEPSFNEHLSSLICFNWEFYHKTIHPNIFYEKLVFEDE